MINFENVESASENKTAFKSVKGGVQDLTITKVEPYTSSGGSEALNVTFESKEADASFSHKFWLSEKAIPAAQYLMEKFAGEKIAESFATVEEAAEKLGAKLIGKNRTVIVDEIKRTKGNFVNTYPILRFAGFVDPEGDDAIVRVKDETAAPASGIPTPPSDLPF